MPTDLLQEVATILERDATPALKIGTTLQVGYRREPPRKHVLLRENGGPPETVSDFGQIALQAIASDTEYFSGRSLALSVRDALHARYEQSASVDWILHAILATTDQPQYLGITLEGLHEFSVGFIATFTRRRQGDA